MKQNEYTIKARIWLYDGVAAWHFITVPKKESESIPQRFGLMKRGWGSLPVIVTIGKTSWKTSIFTDKKRGGYLLPLKAEVRKKEHLSVGETVSFHLAIQT